jgi:uncharacterized protein (TIGR00369 family)
MPPVSTQAGMGDAQAYIDKLGIVIDEANGERVVATMPVQGNTQPDGFLHGGATMSLIETLASVGAAIAAGWPETLVVGQQQTCNFLSTATTGSVRGVATPIHTGRTTHVWDVDVTAIDTGKRVAAGRVTLAVRGRRGTPPEKG